jgi:hypothetical protein
MRAFRTFDLLVGMLRLVSGGRCSYPRLCVAVLVHSGCLNRSFFWTFRLSWQSLLPLREHLARPWFVFCHLPILSMNDEKQSKQFALVQTDCDRANRLRPCKQSKSHCSRANFRSHFAAKGWLLAILVLSGYGRCSTTDGSVKAWA